MTGSDITRMPEQCNTWPLVLLIGWRVETSVTEQWKHDDDDDLAGVCVLINVRFVRSISSTLYSESIAVRHWTRTQQTVSSHRRLSHSLGIEDPTLGSNPLSYLCIITFGCHAFLTNSHRRDLIFSPSSIYSSVHHSDK